MSNFLRISYGTISHKDPTKRKGVALEYDDNVVVMDGSGSVAYCEFEKGKKALKYMMDEMHTGKPTKVDAKYAAVTFATLPMSTSSSYNTQPAASEIFEDSLSKWHDQPLKPD
ncbi:hypothetical protein OS493_018820 [Desmophyllum pertusum]|uniref:Uncharacterized protein n=1 Tax=Desmophyllum pertusum TaxID=174260 RepID=A0A9W9ZCL8_9CNID|nr:hypothetical protein OS493_018820 [Desmophyllum pertusum]